MTARLPRSAAALAALGLAATSLIPGCGGRDVHPHGPHPLTVTSQDYAVHGEYTSVPLDRVDVLAIERGRAVLKGAPADHAVDLPAAADPARPVRHWALVTESHTPGRRLLTFTHSELVKDVLVELPEGDAAVRFGVFADRDGIGDVLVFATGDRETGPSSLYGYVRIHPK
jgi:hypothetical protein